MPPTTTTKRSRSAKKKAKSGKSAAATSRTTRAAKKAPAAGRNNGSISNYTDALKWLYEHTDHERMRIVQYNSRTFSLERMRKVLAHLDNPHQQIKCVQIAGTKGKGSTCAMLASMLSECGYTVGVYTSPHLVDPRERITVGGEMISYADLADAFKAIAAYEKKLGDTKLTFFEIFTAAALRYLADHAVHITVLETGPGGRLDSTTVVTPLVCGVTHSSLDHTNILGRDLRSIAAEKAGIFKKQVPAISVEQDPGVMEVLNQVATETEAPLEFTGRQIEFSYRFEANRELGPHTRVCITTPTSRFEHLPVPLRGEHQAHNCGLALAMLDKLKAHGFVLPEESVIEGLANTKLAGRMEQVWSEPRVMIDGAHNAESILALIKSLGAHITYDSLVVIFGCAQDKDTIGMLKQLALGADKVIFTRAKANPRAQEPEDLMARFNELSGKMAQTAPSLDEALRLAGRAVSREDLIIVTGSFYLAGEAKKYFLDKEKKVKAAAMA